MRRDLRYAEGIRMEECKMEISRQWLKGVLDLCPDEDRLKGILDDIERQWSIIKFEQGALNNEEREKVKWALKYLLGYKPEEIKHVQLSMNDCSSITDSLWDALSCSHLTTLDVSDCGLNNDALDFKSLANHCSGLETLLLSGNDLSNKDIWALDKKEAEYQLKQEQSTGKLLCGLMQMAKLRKLRRLDLSKTGIGKLKNGLGGLMWMIARNGTLEYLDISGMGISKKVAAYVLSGLGGLQRAKNRVVEVRFGSSRLESHFLERLHKWNTDHEIGNLDHYVIRESLLTRAERKEMKEVVMGGNHGVSAEFIDGFSPEAIGPIQELIRPGVHQIWPKDMAVDEVQRKKRRMDVDVESDHPKKRTRAEESAEESSTEGQDEAVSLHLQSFFNLEGKNGGVCKEKKAESEHSRLQFYDLPKEIRHEIKENLGEGVCQVKMI